MQLSVADNVDICVTCICDKPPKLPLREELISLGVEVIYNARGTGAKAIKSDVKQKIKELRSTLQEREKKKFRLFPISAKRKMEKKAEQKEIERDLKQRKKSLSYEAYANKLLRSDSDESSSLSSWGTILTLEIETPKHKGGNGANKNESLHDECRDPIDTRQHAIHDAFAAFSYEGIKPKTKSEDMVDAAFNVFSEPTFVFPTKTYSNGFMERDNSTDFYPEFSFNDDSTLQGEVVDAPVVEFSAFAGSWGADVAVETSPTFEVNKQNAQQKRLISATGKRWWYDTSDIANTSTGAKESDQVETVIPSTVSPISAVHNEPAKTQQGYNWAFSTLNSISDGFYNPTKHDDVNKVNEPRVENEQSRKPEQQGTHVEGLLRVSSVCGAGAGAMVADFLPTKVKATRNDLLTALNRSSTRPEDVKVMLDSSPELVKSKMRLDGRLPLHAACCRGFPDRFKKQKNSDMLSILDRLVRDIVKFRSIVEIVADAFIDACAEPDKNGDLPVHLLARRLIEWESSWHFKFQSANISSGEDLVKITRLHQEMAQSIDTVLHPIATSRALCRRRGSLGRILPLHIASIFMVQYDTLEGVVAAYPEAAAVPCDLNALQSAFKSDALPLELLESRRNQNTSEELIKKDILAPKESGIQWTQSTVENGSHAEDLLRRSDLIFAFYPSVLPFRKDTERIQRMESLIRAEAKFQAETVESCENKFDPVALSVWFWMCTFDESMPEENDNYVASVERIVNSLDKEAVRRLSTMKSYGGTILEMAISPCAEVIKRRIDENEAIRNLNKISTSGSVLSTTSSVSSRRSILRKTKSSENFKSQRATLHVGSVARRVFNVKQSTFPTSFVILPYKLKRHVDGTLSLESATFANTAVKFAKLLLELTRPLNLQHILEKKAIQHAGRNVAAKLSDVWTLREEHFEFVANDLLNLYKSCKFGYLYLLDEVNGVPIVPTECDNSSPFPMPVINPIVTVKQMLPLMLMGMVLMRGEKALSILTKTMLEDTDQVPGGWIVASQEIVGYLYSQKAISGIADITTLKDELIDFVSTTTDVNYKRRLESPDGSEWGIELSLLRMLLERFDPRRSICGLKCESFSNANIVWSVPNPDAQETALPEGEILESSRHHQNSSTPRTDAETVSLDLQKSPTSEVSIADITSACSELTDPTFAFGRDDESREIPETRHTLPKRSMEPQRIPPSPEHPSYRNTSSPSVVSRDNLDLVRCTSWRQKLNSQEAYLEGVRERLTTLEFDQKYLVRAGEPLLNQLADDLYYYDERAVRYDEVDDLSTSLGDDLDSTQKVLLRLCGLEERLLSREIEIQQLKVDLHAFTLDAVQYSSGVSISAQLTVE